ncbi:MAG: phenylalanine 4-monooxygenase [Gemmatimonadales bacterium]|nr:MAG: phenylalanine 4-monooxygenase [Gemmatimonadales bacterium]
MELKAHDDATAGLTTTKAPFIEGAKSRGELFITQPWEQYSEENHQSWRNLYARMADRWERYANHRFLEGLGSLGLSGEQVPKLEEVNRFLAPLTGFKAKPVSGYVPAYLFFDCLGRREFPTTITIRDVDTPDYLPEPDIFHDIAGHVPMHTDPAFAETLVRFGRAAAGAVERLVAEDPDDLEERVASNMRAMARFFWFTIEFGLMREAEGDGLKVYGSGLLSSYGEIEHSVDSPHAQRVPFQLEWVINQSFRIDRFQPLLFVVDSFDHLFDEVTRLEEWMRAGQLDHVAPCEPVISDEEIRISLEAARAKG